MLGVVANAIKLSRRKKYGYGGYGYGPGPAAAQPVSAKASTGQATPSSRSGALRSLNLRSSATLSRRPVSSRCDRHRELTRLKRLRLGEGLEGRTAAHRIRELACDIGGLSERI